MDDLSAETGHRLMAIRLLVSPDLKSTIRAMERDPTEDERQRDHFERGVELVLEHHPEVAPELARQFVGRCLRAMEPKDLTDTLKDYLGFWDPKPLDDDAMVRIWRELGLPGTPGPEPTSRKCDVPPSNGLVALPPDDAEFLADQAVEEERRRRERINRPEQVMPAATPPRIEPEPEPPPINPDYPRPDSRFYGGDDWGFRIED